MVTNGHSSIGDQIIGSCFAINLYCVLMQHKPVMTGQNQSISQRSRQFLLLSFVFDGLKSLLLVEMLFLFDLSAAWRALTWLTFVFYNCYTKYQAMFRAIGIGYSRSLPSAAALNWILKDGLGRLSRCVYTASFASAFDTNLKVVLLRYFLNTVLKASDHVFC